MLHQVLGKLPSQNTKKLNLVYADMLGMLTLKKI